MAEKLNVCLLNDSFPPVIDGVANTVVNYAEIIQKNYGNSIVATPSYPKATDDYPFPVFRYPSINTKKIIGYRAGYPFSAPTLIELEKQKVDIIHSHCPVMSTLLARTLRKTIDVPIILTYHTKFDIDISKAVKSKLIKKAALKFLAANIEACDEVWAVSHGAGENLKKLGYAGDYIVMENGVDFPKGRVQQDKIDSVSRQHELSEDIPVFLFVGRMMWYKNVRISLDALKKVKEQGNKFKMIFIGDGTDRKEIEKYAEDIGLKNDCIFTGAIHDREVLRAYFCRSDLFLFPSTYDTNGIVVREAAACGLGSMLIRNSCAAEGLIDNRTGILVEENADSMAAEITELCHNRDRMKDIGQHAMDEIYVSWESSVAKAVERYNIVLENHKNLAVKPIENRKEEFFGVVSDICSSIEKVQGRYYKVKNKEIEMHNRIIEIFDRYL